MAAVDGKAATTTPQAPSSSMVHKDERTLRQRLSDWYLVYELRTALYSLEPWEKTMFNSCLIIFLSMGCYTTYCFLPGYTTSLLKYFNLM